MTMGHDMGRYYRQQYFSKNLVAVIPNITTPRSIDTPDVALLPEDVEAQNASDTGNALSGTDDSSSPTRRLEEPPFGARPAVFHNNFQEAAFVFMATMAIATSTFLTGVTVVVTESIGRDLNMTQSQISWIAAAATYVPLLF